MKKITSIFLFAFTLVVSACSSGDEPISPQTNEALSLSRAEVQSYQSESGDETPTTSLFTSGDMITVVGAADDDVIFILSEDGEWRTLSEYSWMESPQTVYAYYGTNTSISDGDQMPDLLVAEIECNGVIPQNGILSFAGDRAFHHATALVEVKITGWNEYVEPTVTLKNLHSIISLSNTGKYIFDTKYLYGVNLELISSTNGVLTYRGRVPAGDSMETNINSGYSLMINTLNAMDYLLDDSLIPTYFEAGKSFLFSLAFDYTM